MRKKKIILFGGTFDPIHIAHTIVADCALKKICAERVCFIPAKRSPLKTFLPKAGDADRLAMINLAISDNDKFSVSNYELKKTKPSYTLDTIKRFQRDFGPDALIFWLIGADVLEELPLWYKTDELLDMCNICLMYRAGFPPPDFTHFLDMWGPSRIEKLRSNIIETPLLDISSTEIRKRLANGLDVTDMLHPAVADYIEQHQLYKKE